MEELIMKILRRAVGIGPNEMHHPYYDNPLSYRRVFDEGYDIVSQSLAESFTTLFQNISEKFIHVPITELADYITGGGTESLFSPITVFSLMFFPIVIFLLIAQLLAFTQRAMVGKAEIRDLWFILGRSTFAAIFIQPKVLMLSLNTLSTAIDELMSGVSGVLATNEKGFFSSFLKDQLFNQETLSEILSTQNMFHKGILQPRPEILLVIISIFIAIYLAYQVIAMLLEAIKRNLQIVLAYVLAPMNIAASSYNFEFFTRWLKFILSNVVIKITYLVGIIYISRALLNMHLTFIVNFLKGGSQEKFFAQLAVVCFLPNMIRHFDNVISNAGWNPGSIGNLAFDAVVGRQGLRFMTKQLGRGIGAMGRGAALALGATGVVAGKGISGVYNSYKGRPEPFSSSKKAKASLNPEPIKNGAQAKFKGFNATLNSSKTGKEGKDQIRSKNRSDGFKEFEAGAKLYIPQKNKLGSIEMHQYNSGDVLFHPDKGFYLKTKDNQVGEKLAGKTINVDGKLQGDILPVPERLRSEGRDHTKSENTRSEFANKELASELNKERSEKLKNFEERSQSIKEENDKELKERDRHIKAGNEPSVYDRLPGQGFVAFGSNVKHQAREDNARYQGKIRDVRALSAYDTSRQAKTYNKSHYFSADGTSVNKSYDALGYELKNQKASLSATGLNKRGMNIQESDLSHDQVSGRFSVRYKPKVQGSFEVGGTTDGKTSIYYNDKNSFKINNFDQARDSSRVQAGMKLLDTAGVSRENPLLNGKEFSSTDDFLRYSNATVGTMGQWMDEGYLRPGPHEGREYSDSAKNYESFREALDSNVYDYSDFSSSELDYMTAANTAINDQSRLSDDLYMTSDNQSAIIKDFAAACEGEASINSLGYYAPSSAGANDLLYERSFGDDRSYSLALGSGFDQVGATRVDSALDKMYAEGYTQRDLDIIFDTRNQIFASLEKHSPKYQNLASNNINPQGRPSYTAFSSAKEFEDLAGYYKEYKDDRSQHAYYRSHTLPLEEEIRGFAAYLSGVWQEAIEARNASE